MDISTRELHLIPGIQLSEFDSSSLDKTYRVEMGDGRHFQINDKLYWLLNCLNLPHTLSAIQQKYQLDRGETIELDELGETAAYLQAQGIICCVGDEPAQVDPEKAEINNSFLSLHYRRDIIPARVVAPLARALSFTFKRPLVIVLIISVLFVHGSIFYEFGLAPHLPLNEINWPLFYSLTLLGVLVHELGHLAACARWNCSHGPLGVGFYFLNPIFYVDVTSAWRLNRWQRIVVDLGGIYLEAYMMPLLWIMYLLTQDPTYISVILMTDILILTNFEPFMKLDGYWLLSDITGIPNLHKRTGEFMKDGLARILWRLRLRGEHQPRSEFNRWSPIVRKVMYGYTIVSICVWPLILAALLPTIYLAAKSYPALWLRAVQTVFLGLQMQDWALVLSQAQVLFLPTIALLNVALMLRMLYRRMRK